jgi:4a-hydroxytetrahydrobiopterin dehydratase
MTMNDLATKDCTDCKGGVPPLQGHTLTDLLDQINGWTVVREHHIQKEFSFKDFADALAFVNHVGAIAEDQGHHPDIYLTWGRVMVKLWTHKIEGLGESDFIMAAKVDRVPLA